MLKVLIIDDEALARARVRQMLSNNDSVEVLAECQSGAEAIDMIHDKRPDLIYLDIQLSDMTGFDVLEAIPKQMMPMVIFVTAFDEYAIKAFDVFSFDYLLKPLNEERFALSLEKAIDTFRRMSYG